MAEKAESPGWGEIGPHRFVKIGVLGGLLGFLFRGEIEGVVRLWVTDPNWSHGFLIPLFSLYFLHQKRRQVLSLEYVRDPLLELLQRRRPLPLRPGQTRANNAVVPLGADGAIAVHVHQQSGTVHVVLDVSGYFE